MTDVAARDNELNQMILSGRALEAFEKFYADDVEMQENSSASTKGKDVNREREKQFFASVEDFHGAELVGSAVSGDTSYSEWMWDITLRDVGRVRMEQVATRRWRDGQVVRERFYYDQG